jgi:hypothetical protein
MLLLLMTLQCFMRLAHGLREERHRGEARARMHAAHRSSRGGRLAHTDLFTEYTCISFSPMLVVSTLYYGTRDLESTSTETSSGLAT